MKAIPKIVRERKRRKLRRPAARFLINVTDVFPF